MPLALGSAAEAESDPFNSNIYFRVGLGLGSIQTLAGLAWERRGLPRGWPRLGLDMREIIAGHVWEHRGLTRGRPRLSLDMCEMLAGHVWEH